MTRTKTFLALLTAAIGLVFGLAVPSAHAQVTPRNVIALTLSTSTAAANTTTVVTSQAIELKPGAGFAVIPSFKLAGAGTDNITFNFQVSADGTTWTTTTPFTYTEAANGTTTVVGFKNFGPTNGADNVLYVRLASVTNASTTQACTISAITITKDN